MTSARNIGEILAGVLKELATELDIHYDDQDFFMLTPSIVEIVDAIQWLEHEGIEVPDAARHVVKRYQQARN